MFLLFVKFKFSLKFPLQLTYLCAQTANEFSLVETNAAFVHRKWGAIFHAQLPRRALKLAAKLPHCQDILVNMMVAQATRQPPIKLTQRKQLLVSTPGSAGGEGGETQHRLEEFQAGLRIFSSESDRLLH